ncbi:hypothetical protein HF265_21645 [Rhizobium leguminosarum]|nr:hypothetical protein [Rhizobium leguminosarum]
MLELVELAITRPLASVGMVVKTLGMTP